MPELTTRAFRTFSQQNLTMSLLTGLLLSFGSVAVRGGTATDSLVDAAWKAWQVPDYVLAEKNFRSAIAVESSNTRACVGLALLQEMRNRHDECWNALRLFTSEEPESAPYLFAFWQTIRFGMKDRYRESGLLDFLQKLAVKSDDRGVVSAQTTEALEEFYRQRGDIPQAKLWHNRMNAISDWLLIGPFENVSASGYDKAYPPELGFDRTATYEGKSGVPTAWFPIASSLPNTWVDFTHHFPFRQSIFYANTFVYAPAKMKVHLRVGTSGSLRAFLNDELVVECFDENNNDLDTYIVATELQQGWNRVLIKCGCSEIEKCNFLVRITDEHGDKVEGLRVSTDAQAYPVRPGAPAVVLDNAFESFFNARIAASPDFPENYALLAQLYLRDDKAPEAETVLRSALQRWPRCTMFHTLMMETYVRAKKTDEIEDLLVKVSTIDDRLPAVVQYRIAESLRNEEYQKVEEMLSQLRQQNVDTETLYQSEMELLGKRKEVDKLVTLVKKAHDEFPLNWQFATLQALIESELNHSPEKAAAVVGEFLKVNYGVEQLNARASYYLKAGQIDKWESDMMEAIDVAPTLTGYVYHVGSVFQQLKNYGKAETMFRRALDLCPNSSLYWSKLAEVYKSTDRAEEAKTAYRAALKFDPRYFEARDELRMLEGRNPVSSTFTSYRIDSLVSSAPRQADYPSDNAVILLDDTKRVVFEQGASMSTNELLIKVFNANGIDVWKDYNISYNSHSQTLIVEKAVTLKKDGSEVKADVKNGEVVFKSLEADECVYLKWKVKNYYNGMLSRHFWDTNNFNVYFPVRISRYSLLVPKNVEFTHRTQFMPDSPAVSETGDGMRYVWEARNEPAVRFEVGMPGLEDVGKILFISSLPSWNYVANWYSDLALTKTRSTFEIRDRVASLLEGKEGLSDESKVKAIYEFITENIRYSSVPFRQSAFVPQRARDVLVQRIGDCKDVATLCIAMLKEAGIKAHYVLVNTWNDGFNRNIPPSLAFNHCIVGVELHGGVQYLDLTASNYPMGTLPPVDCGAFSLVIERDTKSPQILEAEKSSPNKVARSSAVTLNGDDSMTLLCRTRRSGASNAEIRSRYRNRTDEERRKVLTGILSNEYPNVKVESVSVKDIDQLCTVLEDSQSYTVPQFVSDAGGFKVIRIPWLDRLKPNEALSYETRSYPYLVGISRDTITEQVRLNLPAGYSFASVPGPMKLTNAAGEYSVTYAIAKGRLTATRTFIEKSPRVDPKDYAGYRKFYNDALKEDNRQLILRKGK